MSRSKKYQIKGLSTADFKHKTKVYDAEKQELLGEFASYYEAAKFAGVDPNTVRYHVLRKSRCIKNKLNKILAFR